MALIDKLTAIADAIRGKTGKTDEMTLDQMVTEIEGIQAGGGSGGESDELLQAIFARTATEFHTSSVTEITIARSFEHNTYLKSVYLPELTLFSGGYVFNGCTALETINLPKLYDLGGMQAIGLCTALKEITFPSVSICTAAGLFSGCTNLKKVIFSKKERGDFGLHRRGFGQRTFQNCAALETIVLASEDIIWELGNVNSFDGTPFASGGTGGVLLIPSALVESYKTATNWSVIYGYGHNRFLALEDYTVDGSITGEIDWDKVNALFE